MEPLVDLSKIVDFKGLIESRRLILNQQEAGTATEDDLLALDYIEMNLRNLDFGKALKALKQGCRISREGWNGKGMYLYLCDGRKIPIGNWETRTPAQEPTETEVEHGEVEILPHIDMYTVNRDGRRGRLCGWLASQTDMLSEDWYVVL